jgi:predicted enzyme related to lactoylglutathione lyase
MGKLGTFIWHDLMTTDFAASKLFYTKLFDWKLKEHPEYTELTTAQGRDQGGMMAQDPSRGIPSHWIGYVLVENVDKTAARATEIGGKVLAPPMDIPNVGRFAVLQDPTGAAFMPFVYTGEHPKAEEGGAPTPGRFCWDELLTNDPEKAVKFYTTLFGWEVTRMDMGGGMTYWMARKDGVDTAGVMQSPPNAPHPPMWLSYVAVKDVDAKAKQAQELGGRVFAGPQDIPNVGRFAVLGDPTGATIALFRSNKW